MKKLSFIYIVIVINITLFAENDIRSVKAEYERCASQMERVERSIKKYEELTKSLWEKSRCIKDNVNLTKEISSLVNKVEYFRNRYERAKGQADRINSDLKEVKGPICPSCIESSVNLYCRNSENLQNEIEDYISKAWDLEAQLANVPLQKNIKEKENLNYDFSLYKSNKQKIDSLYKTLIICKDSVAEVFNLQIKKNSLRADSLYKNQDVQSALKCLKIIESLINKISKRCSDIR